MFRTIIKPAVPAATSNQVKKKHNKIGLEEERNAKKNILSSEMFKT